MASLLSTLDQNASLTIQTPSAVTRQHLALPNGGSRNVLVRIPSDEVQQAKIVLSVAGQTISPDSISPLAADHAPMIDQIYRSKLMNLISENLPRPSCDAVIRVRLLFEEIRGLSSRTPFLENVLIDLVHADANHGQVERAFLPDYFPKWGNHYLRSLLRFHAVEQCGNFKDQSLQLYATPQFTAMQTIANKLFINLPPPHHRPVVRESVHGSGNTRSSRPPPQHQPVVRQSFHGYANTGSSRPPQHQPVVRESFRSYAFAGSSHPAPALSSHPAPALSSYPAPAPALSMARLYSAVGSCFGGDCWVDLKCGRKMLRELRKGDLLFDGGVVECVVETVMPPDEISDFCMIGRAIITPYHPIEVEGEWVFPCSIAPMGKARIPSWFNLVVQGNKIVRVEGVKAVTLAHGMTQGVLAHPYFGTTAVVDALKKYPGYADGYVRPQKPVNFVRNAEGMIISGF
jgi:hypothetical protein